MRPSFIKFIPFLLVGLFPVSSITAQNIDSTVTGVVFDASGAVLPGTHVVLINRSTNAEFKTETNASGSYRFSDIPPGPGYEMTFSHDGFAAYKVKDVYVNVANSRTQNAKLSAGSNVVVEVNADGQGVTINTEDATIGNNFQVEQLNDLPVQSRTSPAVLFTLQPGITLNGATTGARVDQTNTTLDGQDVNDFATGNFGSIIGNAPVDSVQEFRGTTAGFTPNSGQGGGGQFQLVTKSGTNHFHGNINEYHRDNSTTANTWFNDNLSPVVRAPKLVRNQFGGNIGGPILHDKVFFFFNYNVGRIAQQATQTRTVPLPSFGAGNVSYINNNTGCLKTSRQNTTPSCISPLTPAQVVALDPAGIGASPALAGLLKRYPAPNDLTGGDGVNTGLFRFNSGTPDNLSGYVGRVDYKLSGRISVFGRGTVTRENQVRTASQFPGDLPASQFVDRSYGYVVGMIWQLGRNKINQLTYGDTVADLSFPRPTNALGGNQVSFVSGTTTLLSAPYASPSNSQARHVPVQQIADDFTWPLSRHSISFGGFYKWINTSSKTVLDYNSDTVGLGGQTQSFVASFRPPNILPNGTVGGVNNGTTAGVTFDSASVSADGRHVETTNGSLRLVVEEKSLNDLSLAFGNAFALEVLAQGLTLDKRKGDRCHRHNRPNRHSRRGLAPN
jgi:Carboxypeptidase regulatory-like domain